MPELTAPKEAVLLQLRGTEKIPVKNPQQAEAYTNEIAKLEQAGYVNKLSPKAVTDPSCSGYIPHHMVQDRFQLLVPVLWTKPE